MLKKVIISPPFSNYIPVPNTTKVLGTYTINRREGAIKQFIKTFRPYEGGYINKIGLRNKGLVNFVPTPKNINNIVSITALEYDEWVQIHNTLTTLKARYPYFSKYLELNISCPNVSKKIVIDKQALSYFSGENTIVKLPPTDSCLDYIKMALEQNITNFHLCNTIPTERGGVSGKLLKVKSLEYIRQAKELYGDNINIIGGGGIYTPQDAKDYLELGCKHLSLSTIMLKPWRVMQIINYVNKL